MDPLRGVAQRAQGDRTQFVCIEVAATNVGDHAHSDLLLLLLLLECSCLPETALSAIGSIAISNQSAAFESCCTGLISVSCARSTFPHPFTSELMGWLAYFSPGETELSLSLSRVRFRGKHLGAGKTTRHCKLRSARQRVTCNASGARCSLAHTFTVPLLSLRSSPQSDSPQHAEHSQASARGTTHIPKQRFLCACRAETHAVPGFFFFVCVCRLAWHACSRDGVASQLRCRPNPADHQPQQQQHLPRH